jgi:large subunit ribosomal protein L1
MAEKKVKAKKTEEVKVEVKEAKVAKAEVKEVKKVKKANHSAIYDKIQTYGIAEAIAIVRQLTKTKFDSSAEVHFRLGVNTQKSEQQVRGTISLPHGTGKSVKIAAFVSAENEAAVKAAGADLVGGEELINEIKKTEKTDFEVAIAEPSLMKNLAVIAKILGTRGLMPSPKNDTVTTNPVKTVGELKKGKISFKNDDTGNIHAVIGKMSFDDQKLKENYEALIEAVRKAKPAAAKGTFLKNISISSSMSPGVKVIIS